MRPWTLRWSARKFGLVVLAVASVVGLLAVATDYSMRGREQQRAAIGGPFSLINHRGHAVTERDYSGKPTLMFFGFTNCPDICPTTLFELTMLLKEIGPDADRLNVLFVTVDPERDTPEQMALYLSSFDPRITGLTGSVAAIDATIKSYAVYARRIPQSDGGYTMDHTSLVYLMDARGDYLGSLVYDEPRESKLQKIRRLLAGR